MTAHARAYRILLIASACALAVLTAVASTAATPASVQRIPALGSHWFAAGTQTLPESCVLGCAAGSGIAAQTTRYAAQMQALTDAGIHVLRVPLVSADGHQLARAADGSPLGAPTTLGDLDALVTLADRYDIYLDLTLVPGASIGGSVPAAWFTDPVQRAAFAASLAPLFARHANDSHVLAWELVGSPESATDSGAIPLDAMRATIAALAASVHQAGGHAMATALASGIDRLPDLAGLGLDVLSASWDASVQSSGPACAGCVTAAGVAAAAGAGSTPIVIGSVNAASPAQLVDATQALYAKGYAGAIVPAAARNSALLDGIRGFIYTKADTGPRLHPLNPCTGPDARQLECPNLVMALPADISPETVGHHVLLRSTNAIEDIGRGPAEITGHRTGPLTMAAEQVIHRVGGGTLHVKTGASLFFKAIPGQGRYWKWDDAAQFSLWHIDASGHPTTLVRVGPKHIYCLRDLKHFGPGLHGSPRSAVFPGCNRSGATRRDTLGTSVGWADRYPFTYFQNWIDVTGLRGCFAYVHEADPDDVVMESDEYDDTSYVTVQLPFRSGRNSCPGPHERSGVDRANGY